MEKQGAGNRDARALTSAKREEKTRRCSVLIAIMEQERRVFFWFSWMRLLFIVAISYGR